MEEIVLYTVMVTNPSVHRVEDRTNNVLWFNLVKHIVKHLNSYETLGLASGMSVGPIPIVFLVCGGFY